MSRKEDEKTRRGFIRGVAASLSGVALAATVLPGRVAAGAEEPPGKDDKKRSRWGMTIDLDLCTACGACAVACRSENNVPVTGRDPAREGTEIAWMELVLKKRGTGSEAQPDIMPTPCMHCDNPPCVKVCPVGATYQSEEGIVAQIYDRCIGCRYCQAACPYSRRYFNWGKPEWPETYRNYLNPDVSARPKGVVEKCNFCYHRIRRTKEAARAEDRELRDQDFEKLPACAESCPADAIVFGDLDDPESRVSRLSGSSRASTLLEHLGTRPKVSYLGKDRRIE